jgi:hypothetical protein
MTSNLWNNEDSYFEKYLKIEYGKEIVNGKV